MDEIGMSTVPNKVPKVISTRGKKNIQKNSCCREMRTSNYCMLFQCKWNICAT
jgi:hypothetical protein